MQIFNFTPQETKALIFLTAALLVGSGITLYKRTHPRFAPELVLEKKEVGVRTEHEATLEGEEKTTKINLNQATAAQLELLPYVGPELSRRIVEYRRANGAFQQIEDIMKVRGIGPKTFQRIKDHITTQ